MRQAILRFLLILTLAAVAYVPLGCNQHGSMDAREANSTALAQDPNVFETKNPEQFPLVTAVKREVPDVLTVTGQVTPDVNRTVHINALAGGRVEEVKVRLGDSVQKGQLLMLIRSTDLETAIAQYKSDKADLELSTNALKRANDLFGHGALAQADLEIAQDNHSKAEVSVGADEDRIRVLGGDVDRLSPVISVHSPITGVVVDQQIAGGEAVKSLDNSQSLFMIADLSRVWVLCDVYENDLGKVQVGDTAAIRLNAYPDKVLHGSVGNIAQVLDPTTRSAKVRVELPNPDGQLRPQMFATVQFTSRRKTGRLLLPVSAILRLHDKDWVFMNLDQGSFRRTEIHAGRSDADGMQEVLGGLDPKAQVVSNALQFSTAVAAQ